MLFAKSFKYLNAYNGNVQIVKERYLGEVVSIEEVNDNVTEYVAVTKRGHIGFIHRWAEIEVVCPD